jgi:hypothetical protein
VPFNFRFIYLSNEPLWLTHHKRVTHPHPRPPPLQIEIFNPTLNIYIGSIFTQLYEFQEDKIWAIHMRQSEMLLRTCWGTCWEHIGNTKIPTPLQPSQKTRPQKKQWCLLSACPFLIGWEEFLFPIVVIAYLEHLASGKGMNCEGHSAIMLWAICLVVCLVARANCQASGCCCVGGHIFARGCLRFIQVMFSMHTYRHCNQ